MVRPVSSIGLRVNSPPQHEEDELSDRMRKLCLTIRISELGFCKVTNLSIVSV